MMLLRQVVCREESRPTDRVFRGADSTEAVSCRVGDGSCAAAHASAISRSARIGGSRSTERSLLRLQRQYGNRYVGRVISRSQAIEDQGFAPVERSIDQARGGGHALDHGVRGQMESAFGANFGGVRIHTDARADTLNQALSARAFATGKDVFFRQGEYNPGSSSGRELLAHELTHVVQQNGDGIQRKMTVSQPGDAYEVEADQMARAVMEREHSPSSGSDGTVVGRQDAGEEDKDMAPKLDASAVQRQPEAVSAEDEEKKKKIGMSADLSVIARQIRVITAAG
jgi:hypothetical protein